MSWLIDGVFLLSKVFCITFNKKGGGGQYEKTVTD
jgi:hypothetical protein